MKHHNILYVATFLLLLTVITGIYVKYNGVNVESFDNNEIPELYDTQLTDVTMTNPIQNLNVNDQQNIYLELVQLFKKFTKPESSQKTLGGNCTHDLYKPETTTIEVNDELNEITDKIMEQLRNASNNHYVLVRNSYSTYDNINRYEDPDGNVRYDYDVFVQDPIIAFQLRLKIDVIKYVDMHDKNTRDKLLRENTDNTCTKKINPNGFATYPIGYPKTRQEIPLPTQVIPTGLQMIGIKGVNIHDPLPIKSLYINYIRIYNTNWLINADELCGLRKYGTNLGGISDGTIESSRCKAKKGKGGVQQPAYEYNQWISVPGEDKYPHYDKPCNMNDVFRWDKHGIMPTPNPPCAGVRDPRIQQPFTAEYNPTVTALPRWEGENSWMFEMSRGNHWSKGGY